MSYMLRGGGGGRKKTLPSCHIYIHQVPHHDRAAFRTNNVPRTHDLVVRPACLLGLQLAISFYITLQKLDPIITQLTAEHKKLSTPEAQKQAVEILLADPSGGRGETKAMELE